MPRVYHRWTVGEIEYLRDSTGTVPVRELCRHLRLKQSQVRKQASRMGVSLRYHDHGLVWCDTCAAWRTEIDADGRCPVCRLRHQTEGHQTRYREAVEQMTPAQRSKHLHDEAIREQRAAEERERRGNDMWKQRVHRAREVTGTRPRVDRKRMSQTNVTSEERKYE